MDIKLVDDNAPEDNIITWVEGNEREDDNNSLDLPSNKSVGVQRRLLNKEKKLKI